jgi:hypothetical protein
VNGEANSKAPFPSSNVRIVNMNENETHQLLMQENLQLRRQLEQLTSNEQALSKNNVELKKGINEYEGRPKRTESVSSSDSDRSTGTVITKSAQRDQIESLTHQLNQSKTQYADLEEKYEYEKHELQCIIQQLREDFIIAEEEKRNSKGKMMRNPLQIEGVFLSVAVIELPTDMKQMAETLREEFEFDLKKKTDALHRIFDDEYQTKLQSLTEENDKQIQSLNHQMDELREMHRKQIDILTDELNKARDSGQ